MCDLTGVYISIASHTPPLRSAAQDYMPPGLHPDDAMISLLLFSNLAIAHPGARSGIILLLDEGQELAGPKHMLFLHVLCCCLIRSQQCEDFSRSLRCRRMRFRPSKLLRRPNEGPFGSAHVQTLQQKKPVRGECSPECRAHPQLPLSGEGGIEPQAGAGRLSHVHIRGHDPTTQQARRPSQPIIIWRPRVGSNEDTCGVHLS